MADLPADIERLLTEARAAEAPSAADCSRIGRSLAAKVGMSEAEWLSQADGGVTPSAASHGMFATGGFAAKALVIAGVVCVTSISAWSSLRPKEPARTPAQSAQVAPPSAAKVELGAPSTPHPDAHGVLERELALMQAASSALEANAPRHALELVTEHDARYPQGFLSEEREALRISALCDLGELDDARSLRRRFEKQSAQSPLRSKIAAHCDRAR